VRLKVGDIKETLSAIPDDYQFGILSGDKLLDNINFVVAKPQKKFCIRGDK
jgi:hypothetical protein